MKTVEHLTLALTYTFYCIRKQNFLTSKICDNTLNVKLRWTLIDI